jgi:alkylation response protein AidB-like acyl-CoA dehydrogenase
VMSHGKPLLQDPLFAARLARVEIALDNMKTTNLRVIAAVAGGGAPGVESSMLKILGTEIRQELTSLLRRALGPQALPFPEDALHAHASDDDTIAGGGLPEARFAAASYFNNRKLSIFGGSNEIQKNIIAKTMLDA